MPQRQSIPTGWDSMQEIQPPLPKPHAFAILTTVDVLRWEPGLYQAPQIIPQTSNLPPHLEK